MSGVLIAGTAKKGAKIKRLGRMCNDCAFKLNSDANKDDEATMAAIDCLAFQGQFNCHQVDANGEFIDKGTPCIGFLHAKQFYDQFEKEENNEG